MALAENMSKHTLTLKDASLHEIISFLDAADEHGQNIKTVIAQVHHFSGKVGVRNETQHFTLKLLATCYFELLIKITF